VTAEMVKEEIIAFCKDPEKLKAVYDEVDAKALTTVPPTPQVEPMLLGGVSSAPLAPMMGGIGGVAGVTVAGMGLAAMMREPVSPAMLALEASISGGSISGTSGSSISTLTGNKSSGSGILFGSGSGIGRDLTGDRRSQSSSSLLSE